MTTVAYLSTTQKKTGSGFDHDDDGYDLAVVAVDVEVAGPVEAELMGD